MTTLPMTPPGPTGGEPPGDARAAAIRANVLAALGRPPELFRVSVVPLWGDRFRVNVVTGSDPTAVQIPHSFFLAADAVGNILDSTPVIRGQY